MKIAIVTVAFLAASVTLAEAKTYKEMFGAEPNVAPQYAKILDSIDFKQGSFPLNGANASLNVPDGYYYLNPADMTKVLVDLWGNPPGNNGDALGMIFPASNSPVGEQSWGAIVSYKADGYVSDADAESTDFNAVLEDLQRDVRETNPERQKAGYDPIQVVGWASPPYYDKSAHALHWARDLLFGTDPAAPHTLNYQLRMLGREGVLEMNFVAGMPDLQAVKASIPAFTGLVQYDPGKTYGDYKDGDKMAAYGLGGLILAGAGAKVAAKIGFLAVALLFLKKGAIFILVAAGAIFRPIMNFFRRKPDGTA